MFDFPNTLAMAMRYEEQGDFALATFHYWLIDFAFEDEDIPWHYTRQIGEKGREGFNRLLGKYRDEIPISASYIKFKDELSVFESYRKYFYYFEQTLAGVMREYEGE